MTFIARESMQSIINKCTQDTAYSPEEYAAAWERNKK